MDKSETLRAAYERINEGGVDAFGALVSEDFVEHEETPGFPPTKQGSLDFFRMVMSAFPDMKMTVEDVISEGNKSVARVTITGTHKGEFMGIPATGKSVSVQLIDIMAFDDAGLICEHWGVTDMLAMMEQLGVVAS